VSVSPCWSPFTNVFGQAGVESAHGVTVRVPQGDDMGVAEKDFERTFGLGHIRPVFGGDTKNDTSVMARRFGIQACAYDLFNTRITVCGNSRGMK